MGDIVKTMQLHTYSAGINMDVILHATFVLAPQLGNALN